MNHYTARSKGTWGREAAKSPEELNRLCNEFFNALVVPAEWKFMGWSNAVDETQGIISVGKAFRDMRTQGIDLKEYRVYFHTFSTKGGLVSKTIIDFGKFKKLCEVSNKTVEQLNEFIARKYNEIEFKNPSEPLRDYVARPLEKGTAGEDDGLQHFRDRFGTKLVDEYSGKQ